MKKEEILKLDKGERIEDEYGNYYYKYGENDYRFYYCCDRENDYWDETRHITKEMLLEL